MNTTVSPKNSGLVAEKVRLDFPILHQEVHGYPLTYLDNAASSHRPNCVIDAVRHYDTHDHSNVHRGIHELSNRATEAYEAARARVAEFLNASSGDEIIFTRGTTEAINLVAAAWGSDRVKPGDKILLTELEHHSNMVPWRLLAERTGAEVVYLPVTGDQGTLDLNRLDEFLTDDVKLFACNHVSNSMGTINPVAELCRRARAEGITTLVDGAQSAGHLPVDVQAIGCDFFAFSGHKVCGPTGIGALFARSPVLDQMQPYQSGGEMISEVTFDAISFKDAPHKFEAGTPNISGAIGLHAALDYLDRIGRQEIFEHDRELVAEALTGLRDIPGIRIFGPDRDRAGVISFLIEGLHSHDLVTLADQRGVALRGGHHCTQPLMKKLGVSGTARASFYLYNTIEEIERFVEVVDRIRNRFAA